jgi:hypothetical protein
VEKPRSQATIGVSVLCCPRRELARKPQQPSSAWHNGAPLSNSCRGKRWRLEWVLRQLFCRAAGCGAMFFICLCCYRGQTYCSQALPTEEPAGNNCVKPTAVSSRAGKRGSDHRDRQRELSPPPLLQRDRSIFRLPLFHPLLATTCGKLSKSGTIFQHAVACRSRVPTVRRVFKHAVW